jgi:hypothetical protein
LKGKIANFIILDIDPAMDIKYARKIFAVYKSGKEVSKDPKQLIVMSIDSDRVGMVSILYELERMGYIKIARGSRYNGFEYKIQSWNDLFLLIFTNTK